MSVCNPNPCRALACQVRPVLGKNNTVLASTLISRKPFTGVIRLAYVGQQSDADILDLYSDVYPVGGNVDMYYAGAGAAWLRWGNKQNAFQRSMT